MKILFVTPAPPFPPNDGARLIVANLARTLAAGHTLYLVSFAERNGLTADMRDWFAGTRIVPRSEASKAGKWLATYNDPLPLWIRAFESQAMCEALHEVVQQHQFDVAHLDTLQMMQYSDAVAPVPVVVAPHDSLTRYLEHQIQLGLTFRERFAARQQYSKMRGYEATHYPKAAPVCVVSAAEQDYLNALAPATDTRVIPNGVDTEYFVPQPGREQFAHVGFLGVMEYLPNRRSALYFAREVMPRILRTVPDAVFSIIGRNPNPEILALAHDSAIRVTGTVEDVRPLVAEQQVMVVPMREAGGIKNKLLEAMAMGKAIVATPEGLEGVDARPGQELLVGANADELADACIRLLRDAPLRSRLGQNARDWALQHSWRKTAAQYVELYHEVINAAPRR